MNDLSKRFLSNFSSLKGRLEEQSAKSNIMDLNEKISVGMIGASIAAMGSLAAGNVSSSNETYTAGQIAMHGAVADLIDSTSEMFKEATKIENTVTIEPGYEFNVYVTENITF